jgi:Family of unknown function (DUF6325)
MYGTDIRRDDEERRHGMTLGPLEYLMVAFEGNRLSGRILSELRAAQEKGLIRVIDLLVLKKDEQGNVLTQELSDLSEEEARPFGFLAGNLLSIFEPDDVELTASQMPKNSAAGLLLIEDTWAIPLKEALLSAGAVARTGGLVAPEVVQMIEAEIEAEAAGKNQAQVTPAE